MRIMLLVLVLASSPAAAAPSEQLPLAVAINCPCAWSGGGSVGGSLFVGMTDHDAVRVNVATYTNHMSWLEQVGEVVAQGDGGETEYTGRIWDVGFAWTHYSRELWSGFTYELGVLRRARNMVDDNYDSFSGLATNTATYAARGQVGWSWLIGRHVFVAGSVGLSVGWEHGTEIVTPDLGSPMMTSTRDVSRGDVSGEGYLRFGIAR